MSKVWTYTDYLKCGYQIYHLSLNSKATIRLVNFGKNWNWNFARPFQSSKDRNFKTEVHTMFVYSTNAFHLINNVSKHFKFVNLIDMHDK